MGHDLVPLNAGVASYYLETGVWSTVCLQFPSIFVALSSTMFLNMVGLYCGLKTRLFQGCLGNFPISFGAPLITTMGL